MYDIKSSIVKLIEENMNGPFERATDVYWKD